MFEVQEGYKIFEVQVLQNLGVKTNWRGWHKQKIQIISTSPPLLTDNYGPLPKAHV